MNNDVSFTQFHTVTKAPDKVKNIQEAIGVFENWLEENGGGASNKNQKSNEEEKVETVPGLGFKDPAAAKKTLEYKFIFLFIFVAKKIKVSFNI